jgi:hypothetical protein
MVNGGKYMKKWLSIGFIIWVGISSCEREGYNIEYGEMKIVVEGWIEEGEVARVLLSRSVPISELVDSTNFLQYAIRSATVIVSDGTISDTLRLRSASSYLPPFLYIGSNVIGKVGETYSLTINTVSLTTGISQTLTAETRIPPSVHIQNAEYIRRNSTDTVGNIIVEFTHPAHQNIYYQVATMVRGEDEIFMPCLYGTFSSRNLTSPNVRKQLMRGVSIFPRANFDMHFKDGDTISVRLRTMHKEAFDFWNLWQNEIVNAANPIFPANTSLKSNINGGVGIWSGYGQHTVSFVAR